MDVNKPHDDVSVAERWDRVLQVLSAEPRRELLLTLMDKSSAAWVSLPDAALSAHFPQSQDDLRLLLIHEHLPKLAEYDYVTWEESPFEARQGPNFAEVEGPLRAIVDCKDELPERLVTGCQVLEV